MVQSVTQPPFCMLLVAAKTTIANGSRASVTMLRITRFVSKHGRRRAGRDIN
jgi:hypothetical protein